MKLTDVELERFIAFTRYMVISATECRMITYQELMDIFGLSRISQMGNFAGNLGTFCKSMKWPLLNSLIINQTDYIPSDGYNEWIVGNTNTKSGEVTAEWGKEIVKCWKKFKNPKQKLKGLNKVIKDYFKEQ